MEDMLFLEKSLKEWMLFKKIEAIGSQSGRPSKKVVIEDSGELPL